VLDARARHQRLHGALQVVAVEARAALVEVGADALHVGRIQLVVEEADDALEEVGARLVVTHDSDPSPTLSCPTGSRSSLVRT
jgi:hypothetical protein